MKALRRRLLKLGMLLGASALLWACTAPIFPVPPPDSVGFTKVIYTDSTGAQVTEWIAQGGMIASAANAVYLVKDQASGEGVITTARNDGSFTAPPMPGNQGDHVLVNYQTPEGAFSDTTCVLLQEGAMTFCP